jgi:hypothetical protein
MLTARERECLQLICNWLDRTGVAPSFKEMQSGLGLASTSGVHRLISGIEAKGYIRRLPKQPRAIDVLKRPEGPLSGLRTGRVVLAERAGFPQGRLAMAERVIERFLAATDPGERPGLKAFLDTPICDGLSLADVRRAARVFLGRDAGGAMGAALSARRVTGPAERGVS